MENAHEYLLNSDQRMRHHWAVRDRQLEYNEYEVKWEVIGKYRERLWFQRLMHMTEEELLNEYFRLARILDRLEQSINESKAALHMHICATEYLHKSMKPFENINLSQHQLTQKELF